MKESSSGCCSLLFFVVFCLLSVSVSIAEASKKKNVASAPQSVTYDGRSLIVDGRRELIFSGAIHYPRSTPEEHDMHVIIRLGPFIQAEWNNGYDFLILSILFTCLVHQLLIFLTKFLNLRGLPYWLREIPGIIFRSDNAPFKVNELIQSIETSMFDRFSSK